MLTHFGWFPNTKEPRQFLLGRTLFGAETRDALVTEIAPEIYERAQEFDLGEGSTNPLEDWTDAASMLFANGCEAQAFALLASFAAPLMAFWPGSSGGVVLSIHGAKHSGKSTAIAAAASVWGAPDATRFKKPNAAAFAHLCNMPMLTETLLQRDPQSVRDGIEMFARDQATHRQDKWCSILISASPLPLADICRVPGVEWAISVPKALIRPRNADHIAERLMACRGCAGRKFIGYLMQRESRERVRMQLASQLATMRENSNAGDDMIATMRVIAACHVAGIIVNQLGLVEHNPERLTAWAIECALPKARQQRKERAERT